MTEEDPDYSRMNETQQAIGRRAWANVVRQVPDEDDHLWAIYLFILLLLDDAHPLADIRALLSSYERSAPAAPGSSQLNHPPPVERRFEVPPSQLVIYLNRHAWYVNARSW
jgi:hypothetical protein